MLGTPWGDAETLARRRLPAGAERAAVRRNHRERLCAAMVASCENKGYEATTVADLLQLSGLSRGTFYSHFEDKLACFCAAEAEIVSAAVGAVQGRLDGAGSSEARARAALTAFLELLAEQPAAARMCLVESNAAGEAGTDQIGAAVDRFIRLVAESLEQMPGGRNVPTELARAIVGGFYKVLYSRVESRRADELPELAAQLWEWAVSYQPLPVPLRRTGRRPSPAPVAELPPFAAHSAEQRIIRAFAAVVAAKGYPATTVADVASAAAISQTTFYRHFTDKADLLAAALDSSGAQMLAATLPSARRASDWQRAVRLAAEAGCGFLASEPDLAYLRTIAVYSAGPAAIATRDQGGIELLTALLRPGSEEIAALPPLLIEATIGAIVGVFWEYIGDGRTAQLLDAAPLVTYLVLAPLLGAERAAGVATEPVPGRRSIPGRRS